MQVIMLFVAKMDEGARSNGVGIFDRFRAYAELGLLKGTRLYTFNTPVAKGKYRMFLVALNLCRKLPDGLLATTKDGRTFSVDLSTGMQTTVFFLGEYEKAITDIVERLIREGGCKTFLDVGANFGWYATLFYKYAGRNGAVHAFEPVPHSYNELRRNYELMGSPENVKINDLALGDEEKHITINLFKELSTGHASLSTQGRDDTIAFDCRMTTLDLYIAENNAPDFDFIKVDIEGSELGFLKGAERLFRQNALPIILMEMALNQTKNFGYLPNDLIEFILARADYDFYKIDELGGKLIKIDGFEPDDIGANVICLPANNHIFPN